MAKQKLPSTATGRRRLLKLAGLLEADAKNKKGIQFDLEVVACHSKAVRVIQPWENDGAAREFRKGEAPTLDCGTAACAVGLAVISGAFARQGFTYKIGQYGLMPIFKRYRGFGTADVRFFQITEYESDFLFTPGEYNEPVKGAQGELRVAKRIRAFVAGKASPAAL